MRRIIIICLIIVGGVFASKAKGLFQIQTSELRDLGISISCEDRSDSTELSAWCQVKLLNSPVVSLTVFGHKENPLVGMTTYMDYPEDMPILTCNNRPKYKLVKHDYKLYYDILFEFYDIEPATAPEVDSLSLLWSRPPSEITEYKSTSYDGYNGQMMDSGLTIDADNCFDFMLGEGIEFGDWLVLDSVSIKRLGVDLFQNPMDLPFVRTKPQNEFTFGDITLKYTLENQIISLWMEQHTTNFYVKYDIRNNQIDEASLTSPRYSTFICFDNQRMKRSFIKTADTDLITKYTNACGIDDQSCENLVIEREYNTAGTLDRQSLYFNREYGATWYWITYNT
ncbi:MAG: hypothetical protein K2L93_00080, partial [Muribaculaceae bacterium]|nr:hypothetical protein [Muribaculaceae bacterium]